MPGRRVPGGCASITVIAATDRRADVPSPYGDARPARLACWERQVEQQLLDPRADHRSRRDELGKGSQDLGALGGTAHHDDRTLHDARLLLQPPGVGHEHRRLGGKTEEVAVAERLDSAESVEQLLQAERLDAAASAGMDRKQHRHVEVGKLTQDDREDVRVVDVLGPVEGAEHVAGRGQPIASEQRAPRGWRREEVEHRIDHRVAGEHDLVAADAFGSEVGPVDLRRCQAEVREVVDDDTVVLLGHGPVEAAQPGFDVHERDLQGVRSERSRDRWRWCRRAPRRTWAGRRGSELRAGSWRRRSGCRGCALPR